MIYLSNQSTFSVKLTKEEQAILAVGSILSVVLNIDEALAITSLGWWITKHDAFPYHSLFKEVIVDLIWSILDVSYIPFE